MPTGYYNIYDSSTSTSTSVYTSSTLSNWSRNYAYESRLSEAEVAKRKYRNTYLRAVPTAKAQRRALP